MNRTELGSHHKGGGPAGLFFVPSRYFNVLFFNVAAQTPLDKSPYKQAYYNEPKA
ncbi:unnamed protein product [marine sediment metagenome]|uniref:Uncharacterized protein n=1 Tax=marine sediment metagenome TaxID=412755 RepID=X1K745_9ZZZZ